MNFPELRFQSDKTIKEVKAALYLKTGTEPDNMEFSLIEDDSKEEILFGDETKTLEQSGIVSGMSFVIVDTVYQYFNPEKLDLEIISLITFKQRIRLSNEYFSPFTNFGIQS